MMLSAALFSGCYTQLSSTRDEEENGYNDNRSYAAQESTDSSYNDNGSYYDDDYRRSCLGYYYSVPVWQTSWYVSPAWSYWDAWWLSAGWIYPAYYYGGYHPYYGGNWHGHGGYYGHNYSQPHGIRSGGYTHANYNGRNEFDFGRSSFNTNTGGSLGVPNAGRVSASTTRSGSISTGTRTATSPSIYRGSSAGRSSNKYNPSVQQPQHRNQSSNGTRTQRGARGASGRSFNAPSTRSSSTQRATPSYSPAPSTRVAPPAPSSAPSRDNGSSNGGGQSGGGRSGGGRR